MLSMEGSYITIATATNKPVIRVYPTELRRQYLPASKIHMNDENEPILVMMISYARTDCLVSLRTHDAPHVLVDSLESICSNCDDFIATFLPSNVTIKFSKEEDMITDLKKMIYFMYPNVQTTCRFGEHDLIKDFENDGTVIQW